MNNFDDLVNIREASELTGKSEMTIRKYLGLTKPPRPIRLPNARKIAKPGEIQETWQIPISDLYNAGLMVSKTPETAQEANSEQVIKLQAEITQLKLQIANLEQSNTDLRANLADLRLLTRAIETGEAQEARRKRFWQR